MNLRIKLLFLLLCFFLLGFQPSYGQNKFKLKVGATGKLCIDCHKEFEEKLKKQFVHTPVKTGECSECHNPHTSPHGRLLNENPKKICMKCHKGMLPENPKSSHRIVMEGNCVKCHDPHSSNNRFVLLNKGNEVCFSCHKDIGETVTKVKFKHSPVDKGCINCHDPHTSKNAEHLLKNDLLTLCGSCHKTDQRDFVKKHMDYPVTKSDCSSCHNSHGSNRAGILFDYIHKPVENKLCKQCHEEANSPTPFKTKRAGYELCRGCHSGMLNNTFDKNRIHWPLLDKKGCINCHKPHASSKKNLLMGDLKDLCGKCHKDTMEWQFRLSEKEKEENKSSKEKVIKGSLTHLPIKEGNCEACHSPHSAESLFLLKQSSVIKLCGACHDWSKHSNHPMGEKVVDTRNKNLTVQCLTCHRSHGSGNRYLIPYPNVTELCVQCHKQYKR